MPMRHRITIALVGLACSAPCRSASAIEPNGEFRVFAECPLDTHTGVCPCVFSYSQSGFTIGRKTVPITPFVSQGSNTQLTRDQRSKINLRGMAKLKRASNKPTPRCSTALSGSSSLNLDGSLHFENARHAQGDSYADEDRLQQSCRVGDQC